MCSIWGTSRPLEAMSVATRILNLSSLKFCMIFDLLFCLIPPCRAFDLIELAFNFFTTLSAPILVFTKISIDPSLSWICSISTLIFSFGIVFITLCLIFVSNTSLFFIDILEGLFKYFDEIFCIWGGKVADNKIICLFLSVNFRIMSTW